MLALDDSFGKLLISKIIQQNSCLMLKRPTRREMGKMEMGHNLPFTVPLNTKLHSQLSF